MNQWRLLVPNKTRKVRVNESDILRSVKFELLTKTHLWSNFKSEIYWDQEVESFESTYWLYRAVLIKEDFRESLSSGNIQGSHFSGLTKFHDISMVFPGFLVNVQVFFIIFKV